MSSTPEKLKQLALQRLGEMLDAEHRLALAGEFAPDMLRQDVKDATYSYYAALTQWKFELRNIEPLAHPSDVYGVLAP